MVKTLKTLSLFLFFLISQQTIAASFRPALIVEMPEEVFSPMGFDDNDTVQVVLYGNLSDTCHKTGKVSYRVDEKQKKIFIKNEVYVYSGCWCLDVIVPYTQTLNIGVLPEGEYQIYIEKPDGSFKQMSKIPVAAANTSSSDDYLYAPVEQFHIRKNVESMSSEVIIEGTFKNSCMFLKEIKIVYRPNRIIEILPIVEIKNKNCSPNSRQFSGVAKISNFAKGRVLVHVRSLNGQALNQIIDL